MSYRDDALRARLWDKAREVWPTIPILRFPWEELSRPDHNRFQQYAIEHFSLSLIEQPPENIKIRFFGRYPTGGFHVIFHAKDGSMITPYVHPDVCCDTILAALAAAGHPVEVDAE